MSLLKELKTLLEQPVENIPAGMKPFDAKLAEKGASIITRDGRPVKFVSLDWSTRLFTDNLVVKIGQTNYRYHPSGKTDSKTDRSKQSDSLSDLFLVNDNV